jgi:hypothetical protein
LLRIAEVLQVRLGDILLKAEAECGSEPNASNKETGSSATRTAKKESPQRQ